jgi:hypothetical protein
VVVVNVNVTVIVNARGDRICGREILGHARRSYGVHRSSPGSLRTTGGPGRLFVRKRRSKARAVGLAWAGQRTSGLFMGGARPRSRNPGCVSGDDRVIKAARR